MIEDRNRKTAGANWGEAPPRWIAVLALACDQTNQRQVAQKLGKSSGYISRLLSKSYTGDMAEAERLVLSSLAADRVDCPFWKRPIPLSSCMRARRRQHPRGEVFIAHRRACDACHLNTDAPANLSAGATDHVPSRKRDEKETA